MKKYIRSIAIASCGVILFFLLWGWIGDYEYCEQVIYHMTQEQYDSVKSYLAEQNGSEPSEREIAHWWADHRNDQ